MHHVSYTQIAYTVIEQYLQAIRNVQHKRNLSIHQLSKLLRIDEQSLNDMYVPIYDDLSE